MKMKIEESLFWDNLIKKKKRNSGLGFGFGFTFCFGPNPSNLDLDLSFGLKFVHNFVRDSQKKKL